MSNSIHKGTYKIHSTKLFLKKNTNIFSIPIITTKNK